MKKFLKVLLPLIICIGISSLFIFLGKVSYDNLITPKFAPPGIVFSIVWTIIYLIFYFTMNKYYQDKTIYTLYLIVLATHIIWNFAFFFLGYFLIGLIILIIMYFISFVFVYYLSLKEKKLFYIYLIYLIWLMCALYLNIGIFVLNT